MDETATFSVTDTATADTISEEVLARLGSSARTAVITDGTACIGGNTLSFANKFTSVNSIELSTSRSEMLRYNVGLCCKRPNTRVIHGDFLQVREFTWMYLY